MGSDTRFLSSSVCSDSPKNTFPFPLSVMALDIGIISQIIYYLEPLFGIYYHESWEMSTSLRPIVISLFRHLIVLFFVNRHIGDELRKREPVGDVRGNWRRAALDCHANRGLSKRRKTFVLRAGCHDSILLRVGSRRCDLGVDGESEAPLNPASLATGQVKQLDGSWGDIAAGERITVQGTRKPDGTFTAQMVQIGGGSYGGDAVMTALRSRSGDIARWTARRPRCWSAGSEFDKHDQSA